MKIDKSEKEAPDNFVDGDDGIGDATSTIIITMITVTRTTMVRLMICKDAIDNKDEANK